MKNSMLLFLTLSLFIFTASVSDTSKNHNMGSFLEDKKMVQVGIIVKDITKSAQTWAEILGVDVPGITVAEGHHLNPTTYKGNRSDARAKLAFLQLENITIELIEPIGEPSTWKEFLDQEGEKIHHLGFNVKGMKDHVKSFEDFGIPLVQHGGWDGGEYSYMDGREKLGVIIELLEHYEQE